MTPADLVTPSMRRRDGATVSRRPMRTTVTRDPATIDVQQWARRYVALVNDLLTREALDRAG